MNETNEKIYDLFESVIHDDGSDAMDTSKIVVEYFDREPRTPQERWILSDRFIKLNDVQKANLYMDLEMPAKIKDFVQMFRGIDQGLRGFLCKRMETFEKGTVADPRTNLSWVKLSENDTDKVNNRDGETISETKYINGLTMLPWLKSRHASGINLFRISAHAQMQDKDGNIHVSFCPNDPKAAVWMYVFGQSLAEKTHDHEYVIKANEAVAKCLNNKKNFIINGQNIEKTGYEYLDECRMNGREPEQLWRFMSGFPIELDVVPASTDYLVQNNERMPMMKDNLGMSFQTTDNGRHWTFKDFMDGVIYRSRYPIDGKYAYLVFNKWFSNEGAMSEY